MIKESISLSATYVILMPYKIFLSKLVLSLSYGWMEFVHINLIGIDTQGADDLLTVALGARAMVVIRENCLKTFQY